MKSETVWCLSENREKSFQVRRLFEHLGFSNVVSGTYSTGKMPEGCRIAYIEYSYKNFAEIERLIKAFNKSGVIFLVHSLDANEPFIREFQVLYPLTMLTHIGLINLSVFRDNIGLLERKYQYFAKLSKVRDFVLNGSNAKLKKAVEDNKNLSDFVLNLLYHHKPSTYRELIQELEHNELSDFHFISFMKASEGNSVAASRLSRVSKKLNLAYFGNKCLAQRYLTNGDLVNYSVYCLESLNFHPLDSDSLSGVIYSALVTGKGDCAVTAIKCRERFGILSIEDFNQLSISVLINVMASKQTFDYYVCKRREHKALLTNLVRKFGLGQKRYVNSVLEVFFAYLTLRVGKDKAALRLLQRWDSCGYKIESGSVPLVIKKTILVELGSLRESKRLFESASNCNVKLPDGYMDVVRFNLNKYKHLAEQYNFLRVNFDRITYKAIMGVYAKYPLSYEINAIFSRKAILGRDFIPTESVKKQLSNNIRCLNKVTS